MITFPNNNQDNQIYLILGRKPGNESIELESKLRSSQDLSLSLLNTIQMLLPLSVLWHCNTCISIDAGVQFSGWISALTLLCMLSTEVLNWY